MKEGTTWIRKEDIDGGLHPIYANMIAIYTHIHTYIHIYMYITKIIDIIEY